MENENIVKETALSVAKETVKEVYADTVQPTAKNVGGFFGTLSGFFNHVVMYPLKKLNICKIDILNFRGIKKRLF